MVAGLTENQWDELNKQYGFNFARGSQGRVIVVNGTHEQVAGVLEALQVGNVNQRTDGYAPWQWGVSEKVEGLKTVQEVASKLYDAMLRTHKWGIFRKPLVGAQYWAQFVKELNSGPHPVT